MKLWLPFLRMMITWQEEEGVQKYTNASYLMGRVGKILEWPLRYNTAVVARVLQCLHMFYKHWIIHCGNIKASNALWVRL
ncbi:hypothetical protein EJB05_12545, partial [Eragrostis curvula]